jgi:hypothetical protein
MVVVLAHVAVGELDDCSGKATPSASDVLHVLPEIDSLVDSLIAQKGKQGGKQVWVGVGGAPGSGKSTVNDMYPPPPHMTYILLLTQTSGKSTLNDMYPHMTCILLLLI